MWSWTDSWPSAQPPHGAGDAVDRDLRSVRDAARRVEHAEHHRDAALARERGEVRGRAAKLRHHTRNARQDMAERRARRRSRPWGLPAHSLRGWPYRKSLRGVILTPRPH